MVIVITGASRGIGLETATYLAQQNHTVYGTVRPSSNSTELDAKCELYNGRLFKVIMPLDDENEIQKVFDNIIEKHGKIDVLINNAATVLIGTVESCTIDEQKELFDINYFGPVRTIQAVLPQMRHRKNGLIINIGSVSSISPYSPWENYSVTKFALRGLTESMAASLSPWNIRVCLIEPSSIKTNSAVRDAAGTRPLEEPHPYAAIQNSHYDSSQGDDPIELAKFIHKVILTEKPHVRYQFGEFTKWLADRVYADPTGDAQVESNINYYQSVGLLPKN